jgi:hypothetical protein
MQQQIEVFRPGSHLAQNGKTYTFSEADVAGIAAAYDPALLASPIVLGHPKTDAPAYGWAAAFAVNDAGVLVATPEKVNPDFAEGVAGGAYRYVSMALYEPTDPTNPKPGSWYPRHIGYLGAKAPAIKGLTAAFSEAPNGEFVVFEAPDRELGWAARTAGQAFRQLRDWLIGKFGQEEADKAIPAWTDEHLKEIAAEVAAQQPSNGPAWSEAELADALVEQMKAAFAAPQPEAKPDPVIDPAAQAVLDARAAELDARERDLQARGAAFAESEQERRRGEDATFIDSLVTGGKLPPAFKDDVLAVMAQARGDAGGPAFAEGEDIHAAMRRLLGGLGTVIAFGELAGGDVAFGELDTDTLARRATELVDAERAAGRTLSYADAVTRVGAPS